MRKIENIQYLSNHWKKNPCRYTLFLKKIEESLKKVSDRSERKMALVVKGIFRLVLRKCTEVAGYHNFLYIIIELYFTEKSC